MIDFEELPDAWILTSLSDLVITIQYGYTASAAEQPIGPKFLRITDLQNNSVNWNTVPFCSCDEIEKYKLKKGDIVIARTGATTGKSFLLNEIPEPAIFASYLIRLSTSSIFPPEYIALFMQSINYWHQIIVVSKGSAQPGANASILSKLSVPLPPLNEQRRIVAKIEALKARSQRVKEALEHIPQLLDQFRQSVLAAAFRGDLTADWREQNPDVEPASVLLERIQEESTHQNQNNYKTQEEFGSSLNQNFIDIQFANLPIIWQLIPIRKICTSSFYGPRFGKDKYVDDGIPSIRTTDMTDEGEIILQDPPKLSIPKDRLDDFKVLPGDLLVTRSGSIGVMAVFRGDYIAIPSAYLIRFRFSVMVSIDYIFYYLKSPIGQNLLGLNSTSVTQSNINAEAIKNIPIPIPPLEEQQEIVCRIKSLLKVVNQIKQQYQETKANLDQLDQSILAKAFRGELVPQDPNDEPASVLLERIRAERDKLQTKAAKKSTPLTGGRRSKKASQQEAEPMQVELGLE